MFKWINEKAKKTSIEYRMGYTDGIREGHKQVFAELMKNLNLSEDVIRHVEKVYFAKEDDQQ